MTPGVGANSPVVVIVWGEGGPGRPSWDVSARRAARLTLRCRRHGSSREILRSPGDLVGDGRRQVSAARSRRQAALVGLLMACNLVAGCSSMVPFPEPPPAISDPRACPGSTVELEQLLGRFRIALPPGATQVLFDASVHPLFGEYALAVAFRTTPEGLVRFTQDNGFKSPGAEMTATGPLPNAPTCLDGRDRLTVTSLTSAWAVDDRVWRVAAVDRSDPRRPLVVVEAFDV